MSALPLNRQALYKSGGTLKNTLTFYAEFVPSTLKMISAPVNASSNNGKQLQLSQSSGITVSSLSIQGSKNNTELDAHAPRCQSQLANTYFARYLQALTA